MAKLSINRETLTVQVKRDNANSILLIKSRKGNMKDEFSSAIQSYQNDGYSESLYGNQSTHFKALTALMSKESSHCAILVLENDKTFIETVKRELTRPAEKVAVTTDHAHSFAMLHKVLTSISSCKQLDINVQHVKGKDTKFDFTPVHFSGLESLNIRYDQRSRQKLTGEVPIYQFLDAPGLTEMHLDAPVPDKMDIALFSDKLRRLSLGNYRGIGFSRIMWAACKAGVQLTYLSLCDVEISYTFCPLPLETVKELSTKRLNADSIVNVLSAIAGGPKILRMSIPVTSEMSARNLINGLVKYCKQLQGLQIHYWSWFQSLEYFYLCALWRTEKRNRLDWFDLDESFNWWVNSAMESLHRLELEEWLSKEVRLSGGKTLCVIGDAERQTYRRNAGVREDPPPPYNG